MKSAAIVSSFLLGWSIGILSKDSLLKLWYAEQASDRPPSPLNELSSKDLAEAALETLLEANTGGAEKDYRDQLNDGMEANSLRNNKIENLSSLIKELPSDDLQTASRFSEIHSPDDVTPWPPDQMSVKAVGIPIMTLEETFQERKITTSQKTSIGDPSLNPENVRFTGSTATIN